VKAFSNFNIGFDRIKHKPKAFRIPSFSKNKLGTAGTAQEYPSGT
jgi:hypothetical protein